jgi:hypothetical protein
MDDYASADTLLDDVQKVLKDIKERYHLAHAVIERWRWDLPQISLC